MNKNHIRLYINAQLKYQDSRSSKKGRHTLSKVFKEPVSDSLIFSSLIQVNISFSHVSKEGDETCFHFKRMRRLASKVVKAKAFWTVTEMLTSTVNSKMAKSGSVSKSMLKASFKV